MQNSYCDRMGERRRLWYAFIMYTLPEWPACYAIFIDGRLAYVGQTENVKFRFRHHSSKGILKNVDVDRIKVRVKLSRRFGEWAMAEIRLIKRLCPTFNRAKIASKEDIF